MFELGQKGLLEYPNGFIWELKRLSKNNSCKKALEMINILVQTELFRAQTHNWRKMAKLSNFQGFLNLLKLKDPFCGKSLFFKVIPRRGRL